MAASEDDADDSASSDYGGVGRTAAMLGRPPFEVDEIALLLEILGWTAARVEKIEYFDERQVDLVFIDGDQPDFSDVAAAAAAIKPAPIIAVLLSASNMAVNKSILEHNFHKLLRPLDLTAVERLIEYAT
jgi:AmiR/NasT family two-component response regulator